MAWTDDRVAILEKLWGEGKSAAEIAKELGEGVTRNAVIGKAHRMGMSGRPSPIKKKKAGAAVTETAKVAAVKPVAKTVTEAKSPVMNIKPIPANSKKVIKTGEGISILELTDKLCKWPIGDPRDDDFHFCGGKSLPGVPYCGPHAMEAYQPSSKNKRRK